MYSQHHRFRIHNQNQHPFRHNASDFAYIPPGLDGIVSSMGGALDWLFKIAYPHNQGQVATVGDLPAAGNTILDYYIVSDDGDGKAAGYRWDQWEGEVAPSWHKVYDMDWGESTIISGFIDKTQDIYVKRAGYDDIDPNGTPYVGDLAGQHIYGGATANTNLTLFANSGDGVGPNTGYVQFGDNVRPLVDSSFSLGSSTYRFLNVFTDSLTSGTMTIAAGSITDTSGAIDFGNENLSTLGFLSTGTLTIQSGSITDTSGSIDFDNENLTTTGNVSGAIGGFTTVNTTTLNTTNLSVGALSGVMKAAAGVVSASSLVNADVSATAAITLSKLAALNASIVPVTDVSGFLVNSSTTVTELGYLNNVTSDIQSQLDGKASTSLNNLGVTAINANLIPNLNETRNLGTIAARWNIHYLKTINDGTNQVESTVLTSFREVNTGVADGMVPFWNNANQRWEPSLPDSEIDHGTLTGILDDDHTQYALLLGRAGGTTINGSPNAGDHLTLRGSSDLTSRVIIGNILRPGSNNTLDIGESSLTWKDVYTSGQFYGLRLENVVGLPGASGSNPGRLVYDSSTKDISVDEGGTWRRVGVERFSQSDAWNGVDTSKVITTSGSIDDAREAFWWLVDDATTQEIQATFTKTATQVTISVGIALPAGNYTLRGIR